jgi:hypothetical protein
MGAIVTLQSQILREFGTGSSMHQQLFAALPWCAMLCCAVQRHSLLQGGHLDVFCFEDVAKRQPAGVAICCQHVCVHTEKGRPWLKLDLQQHNMTTI